jgi:hypothetical protein
MPYTEFIKPLGSPSKTPAALAAQLLRRHWQRRPNENPFRAYANTFSRHVEQLQAGDSTYFHGYAFNTLRQAGANFGLLESFLAALPCKDLAPAATSARILADGTKTLQFQLARAVARKRFDGLQIAVSGLGDAYEKLMEELGNTAILKESQTPSTPGF